MLPIRDGTEFDFSRCNSIFILWDFLRILRKHDEVHAGRDCRTSIESTLGLEYTWYHLNGPRFTLAMRTIGLTGGGNVGRSLDNIFIRNLPSSLSQIN